MIRPRYFLANSVKPPVSSASQSSPVGQGRTRTSTVLPRSNADLEALVFAVNRRTSPSSVSYWMTVEVVFRAFVADDDADHALR